MENDKLYVIIQELNDKCQVLVEKNKNLRVKLVQITKQSKQDQTLLKKQKDENQ